MSASGILRFKDYITNYDYNKRKLVASETINSISNMFKSIDIATCPLIHDQVTIDNCNLYAYISKWLNLENNADIMLNTDDSVVQ